MMRKIPLYRSNKCRFIFLLLIASLSLIFFIIVYSCTGTVCFGVSSSTPLPFSQNELLVRRIDEKNKFDASVLHKVYKLDFEGSDILVYLHIQKTGGATFGRHLVHNLAVNPPCHCQQHIKKCECVTSNKNIWLLSRHSTGWVCGLHADWTELNDCVDEWFKNNDLTHRAQRRYYYITFLRNPVSRFLSEWQHVKRGATWKAVRLHCNGRDATLDEVPFCFHGSDWSGVSFDEFISCKHNLAFNRMTRMLANLSRVNCYNRTGMNEKLVESILLQSAKENLLNVAFFGIVEEQEKTQFLFEQTFGIKFLENLKQKEITHVSQLQLNKDTEQRILEKNTLDVLLYDFAKDLFLQRVEEMETSQGYTVQEYFHHIRDSIQSAGLDDIKTNEASDEDNEYVEEEDKLISYPSKGAANAPMLRKTVR